jgi:hypothetical protein
MDHTSEYRLYAMECAAWAERTVHSEIRVSMLRLAAAWMKAAEAAERPALNKQRRLAGSRPPPG